MDPTPPPVPPSLPPAPPPPSTAPKPPTSRLAIASLVLGLLPCGITGVAGLVCGILAKSRIAKSGGRLGGAGLATAGIIVSAALGVLLIPLAAILAGLLLPALAKAKGKAQNVGCVSHLKQLGLALRIYAADNTDKYPLEIGVLTNELAHPKLLLCPQDSRHVPAPDWAHFTPQNSSYPYFGAKYVEGGDPQAVISYCTNHGRAFVNVLLGDGSVQQLRMSRVELSDDGTMKLR